MEDKVFGIIPARYASTRFPGKPLADVGGVPLVRRVYERVQSAGLQGVAVATDDMRIADCVRGFGGNVVMTSPDHPSGTDRCREAAEALHPDDNDVVINIQGDEPFISEKELALIASAFDSSDVEIATLANVSDDNDILNNPNCVKIVTNKFGDALYFSRAPIPFKRDNTLQRPHFLKHIGIYAYRYKTLREITRLETSTLENCEKLEQLRWLENGFKIRVLVCDYKGIGIDTPEDLHNLINNLI